MIKRSELVAYSSLAIPLAFVELPLFIHLPKFYSEFTSMTLAEIGLVLLIVRFLDAIKDPVLGYYADLKLSQGISRIRFIAFFIPLLIIGFLCLWNPIGNPILWLALSLLLVQLADGASVISYHSLGAEITDDYYERTRITSMREGFRIAGLLLAGVIPTLLAIFWGKETSYNAFAVIFGLTLLLTFIIFAKRAPRNSNAKVSRYGVGEFRWCFQNKDFLWIMGLHMLNVFAFAIPTALLAFFIDDVLGGKAYEGIFFAVYFLAGIVGMGLWARLAKSYGKKGSWICSQIMGILALLLIFFVTSEDFLLFGVVFAVAGLSFGADLALPPSILADAIDKHHDKNNRSSASYFSIWNITAKLSTALAPGIVFPLLGFLHYTPHVSGPEGIQSLTLIFVLLPVIVKIIVTFTLIISPVDNWKISDFMRRFEKII